jgi:hypothetical protein
MPMMFFYFLKIIFDISTSKRSKKYKPHSILAKKKKQIQIWTKRRYKRNTKHSLKAGLRQKKKKKQLNLPWIGLEVALGQPSQAPANPGLGSRFSSLTRPLSFIFFSL